MDAARKKLIILIVCVVCAMEIVYVVAANTLLRSEYFSELLNPHPEKLSIRFDAPVSYWPGHLRLDGFEIKGHNGNVKWQVATGKLSAQLSLIPLLWRTLEVNSLQASTAKLRLDLWQARLPKSPQSKKRPFHFIFHDIDIKKVEELALHRYIYHGGASIEGAFDLRPGEELNVWNSKFNFLGGTVTSQNAKVLENIEGELSAALLDYHPHEDKGVDVLDNLKHASLRLSGNLNDPDFINLYLRAVPWITLSKLKGALQARVEVRDGVLQESTGGEVKAERIDLKLGPYHSESWGRVKWDLAKETLKMNMALNDYKFLGLKSKKAFINGKSLSLNANTKSLRLRDIFSKLRDLDVDLGVDKAQVTDLGVLNDFIPVTDKFAIQAGEADLNARIYLSTRGISKKGFLKFKTRGARSTFRDMKFTGDAEFECVVQDSEKNIDTFEVTDTRLKISGVNILKPKTSAQRKVKNWGGTFIIPEAVLQPNHSVTVAGNFGMEYDNAEPLLIMLGAEFRLIRLLQAFAAVDKLSGSGQFKIGPKLLDFSSIKVNSSDVDLLGRYRFFQNKHKFVTWFRFDTFKAGVEYDGKESHFSVTNALRWYEKRAEWPAITSKKIHQSTP